MSEPPTPTNEEVTIIRRPASRMVVATYHGSWDTKTMFVLNNKKKKYCFYCRLERKAELVQTVKQDGINVDEARWVSTPSFSKEIHETAYSIQ